MTEIKKQRYEYDSNTDEQTKHIFNIFNMALDIHDSYITVHWIYKAEYHKIVAIADFSTAHKMTCHTGNITKLTITERYLLIQKCKKKYFNENNIDFDFDTAILDILKLFNLDRLGIYYKIMYTTIHTKHQLLKEKHLLLKKEHKSLKEHVLAQPDGELYFEAKKDWDSKNKKNE